MDYEKLVYIYKKSKEINKVSVDLIAYYFHIDYDKAFKLYLDFYSDKFYRYLIKNKIN